MTYKSDNHDYTIPETNESNWDVPLQNLFEAIDNDIIIKGDSSNRPTSPPDDTWFLDKTNKVLEYYDGVEWKIVGGIGSSSKKLPESAFKSVESQHLWMGEQSDAPTDSEIGSGNIAIYAKTDGQVYRKPHGGSEGLLGSGASTKTISPTGVELETANAVSMGVPVPDGKELSVASWGVRTSSDTTPTGLLAQLTQSDGTVIGEENTAYNGSVSVSATNSSGGVKWYHFRIKNETGTDYVDGSSPDSVLGNFEYNIV